MKLTTLTSFCCNDGNGFDKGLVIRGLVVISLLQFMLLLSAGWAGAASGTGADITTAINQARAANGKGAALLPPLVLNNNLSLSAAEAAQDSHAPLNDILHKRGLIFSRIERSRATVYFNNFQSAGDSISRIVEELVNHDLRIARAADRTILNPAYTDFGYDLRPLSKQVGRRMYNGYQLTVLVGETAYSNNDYRLLQLINQARRSPLSVAASLGLDKTAVKRDFAGDGRVLTDGLPPLGMNGDILTVTNSRSVDNLKRSMTIPDNWQNSEIRAALTRQGYPAQNNRDVSPCDAFATLTFSTNLIDPGLFIGMFFNSTLKGELTAADKADYCFLQAGITDAGITVLNGETYNPGAKSPSWTTLQTMGIFAASRKASRPEIIGTVYRDNNHNGLYDIGEGLAGAAVVVTGMGRNYKLNLYTNGAGGFTVPVGSGVYQVRIVTDYGTRYRRIRVDKENAGLDFKL